MVKIDVERHEVKVDGKQKDLSPKEFAILRALATANGKVISRKALLVSILGDKHKPSESRTVDQHLARLRKNLGAGASAIQTVPGSGYKAVGVTFSYAPLCPMAYVQNVKRTSDGTRAEILWKNAFPLVKRGAKVVLA